MSTTKEIIESLKSQIAMLRTHVCHSDECIDNMSYPEYRCTCGCDEALTSTREVAESFIREKILEEFVSAIEACESCKDTGDSTGIERDVEIWNRAVAYCATAITKNSNERKEK